MLLPIWFRAYPSQNTDTFHSESQQTREKLYKHEHITNTHVLKNEKKKGICCITEINMCWVHLRMGCLALTLINTLPKLELYGCDYEQWTSKTERETFLHHQHLFKVIFKWKTNDRFKCLQLWCFMFTKINQCFMFTKKNKTVKSS